MSHQPKGYGTRSKSLTADSADSSIASGSAAAIASSSQFDRDAPAQTEPVFFWKPDELNGFLGQWYKSPFMADNGTSFCSCEQYMMWSKAEAFGDEASKAAILKETSPRKLKALGKKVRGFDDARWDSIKFDVVVQGNLYKFRQCDALDYDRFVYGPDGFLEEAGATRKSLEELLLATGDSTLAEASAFDCIWGIGYTAANAERAGRKQWGQNLLGEALMEVRRRLREEGEKKRDDKKSDEKKSDEKKRAEKKGDDRRQDDRKKTMKRTRRSHDLTEAVVGVGRMLNRQPQK